MNEIQPPVAPPGVPAVKLSSTPWYRSGEIWLGIGLFYAVIFFTGLLWIILTRPIAILNIVQPRFSNIPFLADIAGFLPFLILLGMLIFFLIRRQRIALGMLVGFAFALVVGPLILGVFFIYSCFSFMNQL